MELAMLALFADMLPITVSMLVDLSNVKLALPLATPASLKIISVLLPATGPVAPVDPIAPVAPVAPSVPAVPVAPVVPCTPVAPVAPVVPI